MKTEVTSRRFEFGTIQGFRRFFNLIMEIKYDTNENWSLDFDIGTKKITVKTSSEISFSTEELNTLDLLYGYSK